MSGYSRYSGGKGYRRTSYGRPYYSKNWGSTYGKAVGSTRASKTGNKISYYNSQVSGYVTFSFNSGAFTSNIQMFSPFTSHTTITGEGSDTKYTLDEEQYRHGGATWDKGFRLMCAMNQECRLCRMNLKLQPATTLPSGVAVRLASIIDRNLTYTEWNNMYTGASMDDSYEANSVLENQGAVIQTFNGNRVASLNRYSVPTDLKEKTGWMDCSIQYYNTAGASPLSSFYLKGWMNNESTYAPAFTYACQTSLAAAADTTITFGYTVEYSFAFRNPKSGLDFFIKQEQIGYTNPAGKSAKTETADPKTKKELEELAASLSTTDPPDDEKTDDTTI